MRLNKIREKDRRVQVEYRPVLHSSRIRPAGRNLLHGSGIQPDGQATAPEEYAVNRVRTAAVGRALWLGRSVSRTGRAAVRRWKNRKNGKTTYERIPADRDAEMPNASGIGKADIRNGRERGYGNHAANPKHNVVPTRYAWSGNHFRTRRNAEQASGKARRLKTTVKVRIPENRKVTAVIAAGGVTVVLIAVLLCLIGAVAGSGFGIFFSGEQSGTETQTMPDAVRELSAEYAQALETIRNNCVYDHLELTGTRAGWPEVLAVYAVKTTTDPENGREVATVTEEKMDLLRGIFWEMNEISGETVTEVFNTEENNTENSEEEPVPTETTLRITVRHRTAEEMADRYGFSKDQRRQLRELLEADGDLWTDVLYGNSTNLPALVTVARSQVGNMGGELYWSWYGYPSHVDWCACFVSWCAEQCGALVREELPRFASCSAGVRWFRERGLWLDGNAEPMPGMLIFYDWRMEDGAQDGEADHVGIVERVESGIVYTVEGNWNDCCVHREIPIGYTEILGYGMAR